jgi:hypothetical protein
LNDLAKGAEAFLRGFSKHKPIAPALAAGRALGLDGPLTLEALVCNPDLGALPATPAQRALLRALDGVPIGDILSRERMLFHFAAETIPAEKPTIVYLRTGVRAGKTLISVLDGLHSVLTCQFRRPPDKDKDELPGPDGMVGVRPGELVRAVVVAPKLKLARSPLQHLIGTMEASPRLRKLFAEKPNKESCKIRRPDGHVVEIELVAADVGGAGLRSTWLAAAMLDEADFHDDEGAAVNLDDNLDACRARMLSGARIMVPSSPWAEGSQFDVNFLAAQKAPLHLGELAFHSDTVSMNPTVDRGAIARLREREPEVAAREYDAIPYGAGQSLFFPPDAIEKCINLTRDITLPPRSGLHYCGADYGLTKNSATQAIARPENGKATLVYVDELRPTKEQSVGPALTVPRFLRAGMAYGCRTIRGDHYLAPLREEERRKFLASLIPDERARVPIFEAWDPNRDAQAELFADLRRRMQAGEVDLPNDPRLIAQIKATGVVHLPGGATKIVLPKQGQSHGDVLMAVALAIVACPSIAPEVRPPRQTRDDMSRRGYGDDDTNGNLRGYAFGD